MRVLLSLAVASAIGFTAVSAQAASVSFSQFFPGGNNLDPALNPQAFASTDWDGTTQSVSLPQFDASLGTLTSITFGLYGNVTSFGNVTNTGDEVASIGLYTATVRIRIVVPGTSVPANSNSPFLLQVSPALITLEEQDLAEGASVSFGSPTPVNNAATGSTTINSGFSPYIGAGNVLFPLFAGTQTISDVTGGNLQITQTTSARALVTVTYNFSEVQVPEPASLALLGMGLFGAGLMRRRRG